MQDLLNSIVNGIHKYDFELTNHPEYGIPLAAAGINIENISVDEKSIEWYAYFDLRQPEYNFDVAKVIQDKFLYKKLKHKFYIGYRDKAFYISDYSKEDNNLKSAIWISDEIEAYQSAINKIRASQAEDRKELINMAKKYIKK